MVGRPLDDTGAGMIRLALLAATCLVPIAAAAQTAGTLSGPNIRASQVNTAMTGKADVRGGSLLGATIDGTSTLAGQSVTSILSNLAATQSTASASAAEISVLQAALVAGGPGGASAVGPTTLVQANGASISRQLGARFADTLNAADYGIVCDGVTDNLGSITSNLIPAINAHAGSQVDWPAGKCFISASVTATITQNVHFIGRGAESTDFVFTSGGFHFFSGNSAAIEWDHTAIDTTASSPNADALLIEGANTGGLPHNNAGWVKIHDNQIQGQFWSLIHLRNINFPEVKDNRLTAPQGPAVTSAYPSPNNLTTDPVVSIIGSSANATAGTSVGTAGIFLEGSSVSGTQDYVLDPKIDNNAIVNGTSQIELDGVQGGYFTANSGFNGAYGIRAICPSGGVCENVSISGGYFYDSLSDIYLEHMDAWEISPLMLWVGSNAATSGGAVGVFIRDGDGGAEGHLTIQAPAGSSGKQWAWFVGNDNPMSKPYVLGPNSIFAPGGSILIGNDANTSGITAQGNAIAEAAVPASGTSIVDATMTPANPFGNNDYVWNGAPYGDASSDGMGDIHIRRALSLGGPYDPSTITQTVNGATVFSSDSAGNMTNAGQTIHGVNGGYNEFTSYNENALIPSGATMQLTPAGAFPAFASTTASASVAVTASSVTLAVSNGSIYAPGMGLKDASTGAVGSVTAATPTTVTVSSLSANVVGGDTLGNTIPATSLLGNGAIAVINGTIYADRGRCTVPNTGAPFNFTLSQNVFQGSLVGNNSISVSSGAIPSNFAFSVGQGSLANNGTNVPEILVTQSTGGGYFCSADVTYKSSPN